MVVYHSRAEITKKVAEAISNLLKCDVERIVEKKNRAGIIGYITAGRDARRRKLTEIEDAKFNPGEYDLTIIGTPVWAANISPAVRTYLTQHKDEFRKTAFFCTCSGNKGKVFEEMESACGKKPIALLELRRKEVEEREHLQKIRDLVDNLNRMRQKNPT